MFDIDPDPAKQYRACFQIDRKICIAWRFSHTERQSGLGVRRGSAPASGGVAPGAIRGGRDPISIPDRITVLRIRNPPLAEGVQRHGGGLLLPGCKFLLIVYANLEVSLSLVRVVALGDGKVCDAVGGFRFSI